MWKIAFQFVLFSGEDSNSQGAMLHEGSHYFPFEFTLPSHLPSSFKGKHGRLRYFVRMTICTSGGPHPTRTSKFGVQGSLDLNAEPNTAVSYLSLCTVITNVLAARKSSFTNFQSYLLEEKKFICF